MIANSCLVNLFPQKDLVKWSFSTVATTDLFGDSGGFFVVVFKYWVFKIFCDRHVNFFPDEDVQKIQILAICKHGMFSYSFLYVCTSVDMNGFGFVSWRKQAMLWLEGDLIRSKQNQRGIDGNINRVLCGLNDISISDSLNKVQDLDQYKEVSVLRKNFKQTEAELLITCYR